VVNINNQIEATDDAPVVVSLKGGPLVDTPLATLPVSQKVCVRVCGMPDTQALTPAKNLISVLYLRGPAAESFATLRADQCDFILPSGGRYQSLPFSITGVCSTGDTHIHDAHSHIESLVTDRAALGQIAAFIVPIVNPSVLMKIDEFLLSLTWVFPFWNRLTTTAGAQYLGIRHVVTLLRAHLRQLYQLVCLVSNDRDNSPLPAPRPDRDSGASPTFQLACCWA
jgi:hypothetical protein